MTAISDNSKQSIQALYTDFLKAKGLKPRLGQKQMIAEVARILTRIGDTESAPIGFIEAGTGTGKTLAYLVGALPYAMAREMPLVISTATKVSFLLIMFGVLGGLTAFGMIGLFLGPVILAVMLAIWKEWLEQPTSEESNSQL